MNEIGVLYEAVSVEKELPPKNAFYNVICRNPIEMGVVHYHEATGWQNGFYNETVTHWLRPLPSHVPISVERLKDLEKCAELLEKYVKIDAGYNIFHQPYDAAKQALANLNKQ